MTKKRTTTPPSDSPLADLDPQGLSQDDLLHLLYDVPAGPPASASASTIPLGPPVDPSPADPTRTDPDIFSRPAFGQAAQHSPTTDLAQLESESFTWTRNNYHKIIQHIASIEAGRAKGLESNLDAQDLRDYVLKQLIGLSGHPDPKVAAKALDMLAKSKYVGLYEEKRAKPADEMSMDEVTTAIQKLLGK